jgi:hypothetical protein
MKFSYTLALLIVIISACSSFAPKQVSIKSRVWVDHAVMMGAKTNSHHTSEGEMFDIKEGPDHHLIEVDHNKLSKQNEQFALKARDEAKWLTLAWALFILPIFLYSFFEVVYLI